VQGWSESRQRVVAHRSGGREAQLARGGIREHDALLGYEMRGPAGTGHDGVSMAGGREDQLEGARKGNGVRGHRLPSPPCFVHKLLVYFGKDNEKDKKQTRKKGEKRGKVGGGAKEKKDRGGWVQGFRGAWVWRRVGPHTNNARST